MISYFSGDLLTSDCNIICHQVNCIGLMGAGIAQAIRTKYPSVYSAYKETCTRGYGRLGHVCLVEVNDTLFSHKDAPRYVANMFSQYSCYPRGVRHTDYNAFRTCLRKLKELWELIGGTESHIKIGFPAYIGCGLAGGNWNVVRSIIEDEFASDIYEVEIWELPHR